MRWDGKNKTVDEWINNPDTMFFLTKEGDIEIHCSDNDGEWELFHYGNQHCELGVQDEIDRFGRNYTDRQFAWLCTLVHVLYSEVFRLLSCKKIGDSYTVRLELCNETQEMELSEMVKLLEQRRI